MSFRRVTLETGRGGARRPPRFAPTVNTLEARTLLSTTYVEINIINQSTRNAPGTGLASDQVYVFFTQEKQNLTWGVDPTTGVATPNAPGTLAPSFTLAQLEAAGGAIKVDASATVNSARIYLSDSSQAVALSPGGVVSGPTASASPFYYDFVEFALNTQPGVLNIDTTQVDQFGIPLTLQVSPNDPNFTAGSGVIPTLDRATLLKNYQAMATGPLAAFADTVISDPSDPSRVYRLLNPSDVISGQSQAVALDCVVQTSGTAGDWTATLTIVGPQGPAPTNAGLTQGMQVSGPLIPAGSVIDALPTARTVLLKSTSAANPYAPTVGPVLLEFRTPAASGSRAQSFSFFCEVTTAGTAGNWSATLTIVGPIPTTAALAQGMRVSGPLIPAGAAIHSLPTSESVVLKSSATVNPFKAGTGPVTLNFLTPPATKLATYLDPAIDEFFSHYKKNKGALKVEQGADVTYTGDVVELPGVPDIDGGTSTYTVLEFKKSSADPNPFHLYYPFFTTNAPAGKLSPFGKPVPPPPSWWGAGLGLTSYEPPSGMVFGANGVFADAVQQAQYAPSKPDAVTLGAIENVMATALARGYASSWQFREGTVVQTPPVNGQFARTARVTLSGGTTDGLSSAMYLSSYQIANVPMRPSIGTGPAGTTFRVTSPLPIPPTAEDLLTFAAHYPAGGLWSAFANFFHNGAGYNVTIDGRAYALPYDDQGGFSSDLNAATSVTSPASVTITLGPWAPKPASVTAVGHVLLVTGTDGPDVIALRPVGRGRVAVRLNSRRLGIHDAGSHVIVQGLSGGDVVFAGGVRVPLTVHGGTGPDVVFAPRKARVRFTGNGEVLRRGGPAVPRGFMARRPLPGSPFPAQFQRS